MLTVFDKSNSLTVGDTIQLEDAKLTVVGVLNDSPFSSTDSPIVICTEETFHQLTGQNRYAVIDIQLKDTTADAAIAQIHTLLSDTLNKQVVFSNRIEGNRMIQSTYWAFHLVVYAFLIVIAGITILNIVNSISMSVSARMKQYGILRAIGMDDAQLKRMISAEAWHLCGVRSCGGYCAGSCAESEAVYPAHHPLFRCSVADAVGLSCCDCRSRAGGCGAGSI